MTGSELPQANVGRRLLLAAASAIAATAATFSSTDTKAQTPASPLASWNEGQTKQAILDFVRATTDPSSRSFVSPEDRIAAFDQDGTIWMEHPLYAQAVFALYRLHELAPQHPEWQTLEPFKSALSNNPAALGKFTERDWFEIVAVTHSGMSTDAFEEIVASMVGGRKGFSVQATLHRPGLSADARGDAVFACQRIQDLHRHRRWASICARLRAACIWRSAGAGCGISRQNAVRNHRWQASVDAPAKGSSSSTTASER